VLNYSNLRNKFFVNFFIHLFDNQHIKLIFSGNCCTDYDYEDKLQERQFRVIIERKENSLRHHLFEDWKNLKFFRKKIETVFSCIKALLPRKIHAVTPEGFELKLIGFVIAQSINFILSY